MRVYAVFLVLILLAVTATPLHAQDQGRLYSMMRESTDAALQQTDEGSQATAPVFGSDLGARFKASAYSLVVPGWSQLREGHKGRGAFFLTVEAAIWTSFIVFESQGHSREDSYQQYAEYFAGVNPGDRDDDYWRSVGTYRSNEEYNEDILRDERAGIEPPGPPYTDYDAWLWQSEPRFDEYNALRRDANSAYENADLVLVLALVNRLVAFIDAMRTSPSSEIDDAKQARSHMFETNGVGIDVGLGANPEGGLASTLSLSHSF